MIALEYLLKEQYEAKCCSEYVWNNTHYYKFEKYETKDICQPEEVKELFRLLITLHVYYVFRSEDVLQNRLKNEVDKFLLIFMKTFKYSKTEFKRENQRENIKE
jgi:hypothetical protein